MEQKQPFSLHRQTHDELFLTKRIAADLMFISFSVQWTQWKHSGHTVETLKTAFTHWTQHTVGGAAGVCSCHFKHLVTWLLLQVVGSSTHGPGSVLVHFVAMDGSCTVLPFTSPFGPRYHWSSVPLALSTTGSRYH